MHKKIILIFLAFIIIQSLFNLNGSTVYAEENSSPSAQLLQITYESINPSDDYQYIFKRLKEKLLLIILSYSPSEKSKYQLNLLNTRLAELKYVIDKQDISNIETTSQRYSGGAGQLTQFLVDKKLEKEKQETKKQFETHIPILENLRDVYPANSAGWLFIQHDINYLKIYESQL